MKRTVKERKKGKEKGKIDFKRLIKNKITPSLRGKLLCGLPGTFPAAPGGFSSLLEHRTNDSPEHKFKDPQLLLQSKRLDSGHTDR